MKIANIEVLNASATVKAAAAYKGKKAQERKAAIMQVYISCAWNYVESSDVKHLNNIVEVSSDNGQVRAAQSLVRAIAFHAFNKELGMFKDGKLDKKQKAKRDKIAENIEQTIADWYHGELKAGKPAAFNPETRFKGLLKAMIEKGDMSADEAKAFILDNLDRELSQVAKLEA